MPESLPLPTEYDVDQPRPRIYVNGRFLGRPVTGVERFAAGILHALDAALTDEQAADWTILVPPGVEAPGVFSRLKTRSVGRFAGHAWEQIDLCRASRDGVLVSLCNSGPVLHRRQLVVVHDALVYRHPEGFSPAYRLFHRGLGRLLARTARIATVSQFSRGELALVLGLSPERIPVIPNAVDHLAATQPDDGVLQRLGLADRRFLLFVGSPARNKNLLRSIEAFGLLERDDAAFVLVGSAARTFLQDAAIRRPDNCVSAGRLSDGEIKALYGHATALVFPSTYEGFGIPPLEAMSVGCPVIASDIPVVREVCADAAVYFRPDDTGSIAAAMRQALDRSDGERAELGQAGLRRAAAFSWRTSAERLLRHINDLRR